MEDRRTKAETLARQKSQSAASFSQPQTILFILEILLILSSLFFRVTIARHITPNQVRVSPVRVGRI